MIGRTVGHYRILERLGGGGMGVVYKAEDTKLGRTVALKFLTSELTGDESAKRRFLVEAQAAARLEHPNICTVYEVGEGSAGETYIAMACFDGESLRDRLARGPLPIEEALDIALQIARALATAHAAGVLHRDIKPANVMLLRDGGVKAVDFGLAKIAGTSITRSSESVGTISYMAPEQLRGESRPESDLWALGIVLYEMLTGQRPFHAEYEQAVMYRMLNEDPVPVETLRPDVPDALRQVVARLLKKDPDARFRTARELIAAVSPLVTHDAGTAGPKPLFRRRSVVAAAIVFVVTLGAIAAFVVRQRSRERWARTTALPRAATMIDEGRTFDGVRLLRQAEAHLADDPRLRELLEQSTVTLRVETNPPGALVEIRDFRDSPDRWEALGNSPVEAKVPANFLVIRASLEGHATRTVGCVPQARRRVIKLSPLRDAKRGMVLADLSVGPIFDTPVKVEPFWIDETEVTNREFLEFAKARGYERPELWSDGRGPLSADRLKEVTASLRDSTGVIGPAGWEFGTYPKDKDDEPVGGVNWYEADAYCRSAGKELPTLFHWYTAASVAMTMQFASTSNFMSNGPHRVGDPPALGFFGTYDMAGNLKEWTASDAGTGKRYVLGGSWKEPTYSFHDYELHPPEYRDESAGFRCMAATTRIAMELRAAVPEPFRRDYRKETPAGDAEFALFRNLYDYDRTPLQATAEPLPDRSDYWRAEKISFRASYGDERVPVILLLPTNARPPYQLVIFFPPGDRFISKQPLSTSTIDWTWVLYLVRSGRAVMIPAVRGSYERQFGSPYQPNAFREMMLFGAKDLGRAIDYVETRDDIDARKIAYFGVSIGAVAGPIMTTVEPRFRASILFAGGLFSWRKVTPEVDAFNFVPRVSAPTLMVNGRSDSLFPYETAQLPMYKLLGAPEKKHLLFDSGHLPPQRTVWVREILEWLDRHMGPVPPV